MKQTQYSDKSIHLFGRGCVAWLRRVILVLLAFILLLPLASFQVLGNPVVPHYPPDETFRVPSTSHGLLILFAVNLSVNFALYSVFLLVTGSYLPRAIRWPFSCVPTYLLAIAAVVCVITIVGAFADFFFLMSGLEGSPSHLNRYLVFSPLAWFVSLGIIYASVAVPTYGILRTTLTNSAIVAGFMCAANILWWSVALSAGFGVVIFSVLGSLVITPPLLGILSHNYAYGESDIDSGILDNSGRPGPEPIFTFGRKYNGPGQH